MSLPLTPAWVPVAAPFSVSAHSSAVWQTAVAWIAGPALIKIEVSRTDTWRYSDLATVRGCSADGDRNSAYDSKRCLFSGAPVGALIGKIGGSTSDKDTSTDFAVGCYCIHLVPDGTGGPLFLAMNDLWEGVAEYSGSLQVMVSVAPVPV